MATKSITTIETIKLEGRTVGKILQDEDGFFYRPGTAGGLHNPKKDGDHFPSVKAVMHSLNGDEPDAFPQATGVPVKPPKAPVAGKKSQGKPTPQGKPDKAPVEASVEQAPAITCQVRYKLVEQLSNVGAFLWLYAGYVRPQGFKWESSSIGMFPNMEAVDKFLELNGIYVSVPLESVDVRDGTPYNPNNPR